MDKKSKIVMIVCIIIIVLALGIAASIAVIKYSRENIDVNTTKELENPL